MKKIVFLLPVILFCTVFSKCGGPDKGPDTDTPSIPHIASTVVNIYPHDTAYFTEGLEFYKGQLYESSGGDNEASPFPSAMGILNLQTGKVDTKIELDRSKYFGEGITIFNDKLYWLTWKSGIGFVYDANTFKKISEFKLPAKEGWGLTHDSANLIMSDGTSNLYYLTPDSLKLLNILRITDNSGPVPNINELEYINGYIYANQWETAYNLKIDPATGKIVGRLDMEPLQKEASALRPGADVLNGIAFDSANHKMLVTGKRWPYVYEIKLQ